LGVACTDTIAGDRNTHWFLSDTAWPSWRSEKELDEQSILIREEVRGVCEMQQGLDTLCVANEGKILAILDTKLADELLNNGYA
jgi:hypothetical protein